MLLLRTQGTQKRHLNRESLRCAFSFTSFEKEEELSGIFILNMHRCSFRLQSCPPSRQREPWTACWRRIQANRTPLFFESSGLSPPLCPPPLPLRNFPKSLSSVINFRSQGNPDTCPVKRTPEEGCCLQGPP